MSDETIVIEIQDRVSDSLLKKLKEISSVSLKANTAIEKITQAQAKSGIASERLATAQNRTKISAQQLTAATDRAALAHLRLEQAQKRAENSSKRVSSAFTDFVKKALVATGIAFGVKEILALGNAYTDLQNKLRVVTTSNEQLAEVSQRVFEIANKTRTPVEETAKAFSRFDLALIQLGASQEETLRMTETINKALIVSGANTGEQSAALLQLSQAFNKGKLDGDEFRTVMELMPAVADSIAKQMGVARGELLKLAPQGKITAEVMRKALSDSADEIDKKFAKTIPTLNQALVVLKNNAIETMGEIESKAGAMQALASFVMSFGEGLKALSPEISNLVVSLGMLGKEILNLGSSISVIGFLKATLNSIAFVIAGLADLVKGLKIIWLDVFTFIAKSTSESIGRVVKLFEFLKKASLIKADSVYNPIIEGLKKLESGTGNLSDSALTSANALLSEKSAIDTLGDSILDAKIKSENFEKALSALRKEGEKTVVSGIGKDNKKSKRKKSKAKELTELPDSRAVRLAQHFYEIGRIEPKFNLTNPFEEINKSLEEEWKLLDKVGVSKEVENRMQQISNELLEKGVVLNKEVDEEYRKQIETLIYKNLVNQEQNRLYDETKGKQDELKARLEALNLSMSNGTTTNELYSVKLGKIALDYANLKIAMGDASFVDIATSSLGRLTEGYQGAASGIAESFGNLFETLEDGFANSIGKAVVESENLNDALLNVARTGVEALISSLVKLGIQYLLNEALGEAISKSALASQTALSTAAATATAAAWAPAAAMVSLASFGANSVPASAGIASTSLLAAGMALAKPGFKEGGFTGNVGTNQIAGVVHGQEFVNNAASTARNRPILEHLNKGGSIGASISVKIENYGSSKDFEVQRINNEEIKIIARDEARQLIRRETPSLVASEISNPNSTISKSLGQNIKAPRQRN